MAPPKNDDQGRTKAGPAENPERVTTGHGLLRMVLHHSARDPSEAPTTSAINAIGSRIVQTIASVVAAFGSVLDAIIKDRPHDISQRQKRKVRCYVERHDDEERRHGTQHPAQPLQAAAVISRKRVADNR